MKAEAEVAAAEADAAKVEAAAEVAAAAEEADANVAAAADDAAVELTVITEAGLMVDREQVVDSWTVMGVHDET